MWIVVGVIVFVVLLVLICMFFSGAKERQTPEVCQGCNHAEDDYCTVDDCLDHGTEAAKIHIRTRPTGRKWNDFDNSLGNDTLGNPQGEPSGVPRPLKDIKYNDNECHCVWERPDICRQCPNKDK